MKKLILIAGLLLCSNSWADYCKTGKVKASVCRGFIIESCSFVEIDAVERDGKLFDLGKCYKDVSTYKKSTNTCWINNGEGMLPFSLLKKLPDFYSMDKKGEYKKIDNVDYIVFSCVKR